MASQNSDSPTFAKRAYKIPPKPRKQTAKDDNDALNSNGTAPLPSRSQSSIQLNATFPRSGIAHSAETTTSTNSGSGNSLKDSSESTTPHRSSSVELTRSASSERPGWTSSQPRGIPASPSPTTPTSPRIPPGKSLPAPPPGGKPSGAAYETLRGDLSQTDTPSSPDSTRHVPPSRDLPPPPPTKLVGSQRTFGTLRTLQTAEVSPREEKLKELEKTLLGLPFNIHNKAFVAEGNVSKAKPNGGSKRVHLILFNDMLVYGVPNISKKWTDVKHCWDVNNVNISLLDELTGFVISVDEVKKKWPLKASNIEERAQWVSLMQNIANKNGGLQPRTRSNAVLTEEPAEKSPRPTYAKPPMPANLLKEVADKKTKQKEDKVRSKEEKEAQKEREKAKKKAEKERLKKGKDGKEVVKWNGMKAIGVEDHWQLGGSLLSFKRGDVINLLDCQQFEASKNDFRKGGGGGVYSAYFNGKQGFIANRCVDYYSTYYPENVSRADFEPLLELLVKPDVHIAAALFTVAERSQFEYISKAIMQVFKAANARELAEDLIERMIKTEVALTVDPATLFRNNSPASFLMGYYCKVLVGPEYVHQTLKPQIVALNKNVLPFELDPTKLKEGENIETNIGNLTALSQRFLDGILASAENCPAGVRRICKMLVSEVQDKFPASLHAAVGGFVFLRYLVPPIVAPEGFGLLNDITLSAETKRLLLLISKIMQSLANGVQEFKKEPFMTPMTSFLTQNMSLVEQFFHRLANIDSTRPVVKETKHNWEQLDEEHMNTLHYQICFKLAKIGDEIANESIEKKCGYSPFGGLVQVMERLGPGRTRKVTVPQK